MFGISALGQSPFSALGVVYTDGAAVVSADATVSANAVTVVDASASASAAATVASACERVRESDCAPAGDTVTSVVYIRERNDGAVCAATSSATASSEQVFQSSVTVSAEATLTCQAQVTLLGEAHITAAATNTATCVRRRNIGAVPTTATCTVSANGREKWEPEAEATDTWTLIPESSDTWTEVTNNSNTWTEAA